MIGDLTYSLVTLLTPRSINRSFSLGASTGSSSSKVSISKEDMKRVYSSIKGVLENIEEYFKKVRRKRKRWYTLQGTMRMHGFLICS